jgi:hypothetical protein
MCILIPFLQSKNACKNALNSKLRKIFIAHPYYLYLYCTVKTI